jgi:hypothetical protein
MVSFVFLDNSCILQQLYNEMIMDVSNLTYSLPQEINSNWSLKDRLGALRVRFSMGRGRYRVDPGLYRIGRPKKNSEVFVTANYKLSFDLLRKNLGGLDAWILVLETHGINVWCAAGKGTFGSEQLIKQVNHTRLSLYVDHRRLIVPQLGAPGIAAHRVKEETGFSVKFGPVRAADIKRYVASGYKKNLADRTVEFKLKDRFILTPVELVNSLKYLFPVIAAFIILSGIHPHGYSIRLMREEGYRTALYLLAAYLSGAFLAPVLLPLLPFRQFGGKGLVSGFLVSGILILLSPANLPPVALIGWLLISGAVSSFLTMNFTGASTYTSLSGVRREMRIFVPVQVVLALTGLTLFVISKLV